MNLKQNVNNYHAGLSYICSISRVNFFAFCVQSLGLKIWNMMRNRNLKHLLSHLSLCFLLFQIRKRFYSLRSISCLLWSYSANQNIQKKKKKKAMLMCPTHCNLIDCNMPVHPCPSLSLRASSNSCPLSQWCHPTISSCHPLLLLPSISPSIRIFSSESSLHIRWPKYWSFIFSISPSNAYSGLISFRID